MKKVFDTRTIEEAIETLIDYRGKTPPKTTSGVLLITAKVIKDGSIQSDNREFIAVDFYDEWMRRGLPKQWDVLITTEAPLGEVAQIRTPEKVALAQRVILLRGNPAIVHQGFLYQAMKSPFVQGELKARSSGTTVLGIKQSELWKVRIPWYPLPTQRKIASILSAYDDLIENNSRRIAILEAMAQAIYREWFVEFRFPGHENVKLVDSPLGKIPEEWAVQSIGSVLNFHIGGGWGQESLDEKSCNPAFVIRGTDIPDARSMRVVKCPLRYHTSSNIRSRKLSANDLVFEVSGGSKGQPVGRCLFVSDRLLRQFDGDVICASFCKLIRANPSEIAPEILYHYLLASYADGTIERYEVQSTGIKNFKFIVFLESESLVVPPKTIQGVFVSQVRPLLDQVHVLGQQAENFRTTRDLLLPKLISGELDVEDLDIEIDEAVTMTE